MSSASTVPATRPTPVQTSYRPADIRLLIAGAAAPQVSLTEKEARIAAGESYGQFLSAEGPPAEWQTQTYHSALTQNGPAIASALLGLAAQLEARAQGGPVTLVSLARAGFPVGALLHRLLGRAGVDSAHFGLSIVRGVGLDLAALDTVLDERPAESVVFVDGWTGKGSILGTLQLSLNGHAVSPVLAALYDPAGVADLAGSHGDLLLPHAALNATISGLISRTFLQGSPPNEQGHAAEYLGELAGYDLSNIYLDALDALCSGVTPLPPPTGRPQRPADLALEVAREYGCHDPHRAKPGIGEATRVFLRRRPAALVVRASTPDTAHLEALARATQVPVHTEPALPYAAMSLIAGTDASPGDARDL